MDRITRKQILDAIAAGYNTRAAICKHLGCTPRVAWQHLARCEQDHQVLAARTRNGRKVFYLYGMEPMPEIKASDVIGTLQAMGGMATTPEVADAMGQKTLHKVRHALEKLTTIGALAKLRRPNPNGMGAPIVVFKLLGGGEKLVRDDNADEEIDTRPPVVKQQVRPGVTRVIFTGNHRTAHDCQKAYIGTGGGHSALGSVYCCA